MDPEHAGFDVIVVGAGAAGCAVAARLAATFPSALLIEAGPDFRAEPLESIRDGWHMTRQFDWGDAAELSDGGEPTPVRRVRVVGGTSSITRFAMRGAPGDYDEWEALGNPGWGFDAVLPYFMRIESDLEFGDAPWHGASGPIPVTRYPHLAATEPNEALARAFEAGGFPTIEDHNCPGAVGVGRIPMSSRDGTRMTSAAGYLAAGSEPASLTIRAEAQVDRVIVRDARARGVVLVDGTEIRADRVVVCAGVFGSPPLLLRSGIGPADELKGLGIEVQSDLPGVGFNLADHPATDIDLGFAGVARAAPLLHTAATFHSAGARTADPPDLMFWVSDPAPVEEPQVSIDIVLLKPTCRGRVRLRSLDPRDLPLIQLPRPGRDDLERLVEGYRRGREIAAGVSGPFTPRLAPEIRDPAELVTAILGDAGYSIPHYTGTCSMGPSPEDGAVVDANGRVHGIEGLYVVDASIMPTVPSGFTHLPTIMLAERLSEGIAASIRH
jgi:choline dehydrogenase